MVWLKQLRDDVPFIRIELNAADAAEQVVEYAEARARELRASARELVRSVGNQTVRPALMAYRKYVEEKFTENGTLTAWGGVQIGIVDFLVKHLPDLPMDKLDMLGIESCLDVIRKRPCRSRTRPKGRSRSLSNMRRTRSSSSVISSDGCTALRTGNGRSLGTTRFCPFGW